MSENKKIALVTGANKGIGFETVRQLAEQGIKVLLGARDEARGAEAAKKLQETGHDVEFLQLDVNDPASHENARKFIEENYGRLDILVNNAGIAKDYRTKASEGTLEQWRETFETNLFQLIALTNALLPLVKKSEAGRIVNLSSIMGSLAINADPNSPLGNAYTSTAYSTSKTALNMYTVHLANELKETPIKVNAAHPGWVKTDMGGENAPLDLETGAKTSVALATLPADSFTGKYVHLGEELPW